MFHYVACGLNNIWLENGYTIHKSVNGGESFHIEDIKGLHIAIARTLTEKESVLANDEIRFIRTELAMSRKALGELLGISPETIKKWESGENAIPKASDALLRRLFLENHDGDGTVRMLLDTINRIENEMNKVLRFKETKDGWVNEERSAA